MIAFLDAPNIYQVEGSTKQVCYHLLALTDAEKCGLGQGAPKAELGDHG